MVKFLCSNFLAGADGEIKKPLVEALQLAASNKKLEAELRSLQKEHSMLKDMVRDLEHIHDEKHQHSDHESVDSRDGNSGGGGGGNGNQTKSSHRAEGQCICYYCTIFGQSDCAHNNRANETRDRLRKRLRDLQSTKGGGSSGSCKAAAAAAPPPTLKDFESMAFKPTVAPNSAQAAQQAAAAAAAMAQVNSRKPMPPNAHNCAAAAQHQHHHNHQHHSHQQHQQQQHHHERPPPPTPISCAPVDDILKFIEGDPAEKVKQDKEKAAKLAAKKAKQRQRKLEQKKVSELEALNEQYVAICNDENDLKKQLKQLKKRKNKTRLFEAEESIKTILHEKAVIVAALHELVQAIQELNPDFQFEFGDEYDEQPGDQQQARNCQISMDPAKRMVTIRRINLPYSEPQVTVTAKGASPDKDQLLYTFVNGQLVPGKSI